tara:strand:- start:928 stop:1284 length:357 start_codon:yes stop_codon:yes gene_type:complete
MTNLKSMQRIEIKSLNDIINLAYIKNIDNPNQNYITKLFIYDDNNKIDVLKRSYTIYRTSQFMKDNHNFGYGRITTVTPTSWGEKTYTKSYKTKKDFHKALKNLNNRINKNYVQGFYM